MSLVVRRCVQWAVVLFVVGALLEVFPPAHFAPALRVTATPPPDRFTVW